MLKLKFAYATNGHDIIEIDYFSGKETHVSDYPTPVQLWKRYQEGSGLTKNEMADQLLAPFNHEPGKGERYYQQIAINRTVEDILKGDTRILITMATGTGKTAVAFQICWSCGRHAGTVRESIAARAFYILPIATSSSISPRMASSQPSATLKAGFSGGAQAEIIPATRVGCLEW